MSAAYAIALFGVFSSLIGILAFVWAASRGQMRASESAKFFALDADEAEGAAPPPVSLPRRARWVAAALAFVFLCILSSTVLTVLVAARAGSSQAAASSQPAKCPF